MEASGTFDFRMNTVASKFATVNPEIPVENHHQSFGLTDDVIISAVGVRI
jgi:hypothetical protein